MFLRKIFQPRWLLWASVGGALVACGGGADRDQEHDSQAGWLNNPGGVANFNAVSAAYQGAITGLGSIVVNGVRFETTGAAVYDGDDLNDGTPFGGALALGMTVALLGDVDDAQSVGRALRVRVVGGVRGTMTAIDRQQSTLSLPTQTVRFDPSTTYGGLDPNGLPVTRLADLEALVGSNPLLNIYGTPQADGGFLATRVVVSTPQAHPMAVAVRGTLGAVNGDRYTVNTGGGHSITVVCAPPSCGLQPAGLSPVVGDPVRVLASGPQQWVDPTLTASKLQLLGSAPLTRFAGASPTYAKIKGVASQNGGFWYVGGVQVGGASLVDGVTYEIKGTWAGSVLQASQAEAEGSRGFKDGLGHEQTYRNEFYGVVAQRNGDSFVVQGVTVNAAQAYFPYGALSTLSDGQFVEVKGSYTDSSGVLQASKVEIKTLASGGFNPGVGRVFEMYGQVSAWSGAGVPFGWSRAGVVYTAQTSAQTRYKHGLPANGQYGEAKGYLDANNVFQIIEWEPKNAWDD